MSKKKEQLRTFGLTSMAVDNATSIFLLAFMIVLFGMRSYRTMPKESFPEASFPTIFINTPYFGNSANEIENLIGRPIEKEIATITGVKDINSTSIQDFSVIVVEFDADIDQDIALQKVKDAVDKAKSELPDDLDGEPDVMEVNFSEFPIMTVNISGNYSMDELREHAEYLQDRIESLREISEVELKGALNREVKIDVDLPRMQALQISFNDIETAIAQENLTMSGGEIISNEFRRSIRVLGQFENIEEIKKVIVKSEEERPIYLRDLADVSYGFEERSSYARSNGLPVIALDIVKRRGQNIIYAADKTKELLEQEKAFLPPDIKLTIFNDTSLYTKNDLANLENSIISGIILVVLILLFFLGLKNALFVGVSIPLSMLMGILFLNLTGNTLNMMVLFALILALGLLVDNAIVVVENVYRHMQEGYNSTKAAKYGTGEVATPIIVSTLTTLAAFIPLAFWPGIMGEFMKFLPITLIIVLSSSLFVALVFNPVFTSRLMSIDKEATQKAEIYRRRKNVLIGTSILLLAAIGAHFGQLMWLRNLLCISAAIGLINFFFFRPGAFFFQNRILPRLESAYSNFIHFVLRGINPIIVFAGTFALLFGSIFLLIRNSPEVVFFSESEPAYINTFIDLPLGSDIEATNEVVKRIEANIDKAIEPYRDIVEEVLTQIGENTGDPRRQRDPGVTPHKARITISFVPYEERGGVSTVKILKEVREASLGIPGVRLVVAKDADGPPTGLPVNIELVGDDIDVLAGLSEDILVFLNDQKVPGIEELRTDIQLAKPELEIHIDREAARRYGLSTAQIGSTIRTAVFGKEVSKYKVGEDEYPIMVRLDKKYRYNVTELMNQKITFRDQARQGKIVQVPISAVATYSYNTSYNAIKRKDQKRIITIASDILPGYNGNQIVDRLKEAMEDYPMPAAYTYAFTGEQQDQAENTAFLNSAFMVAIFTIFIIIVAQFNSIYSPFIIILSVLFSTIGVLIGYLLTGEPIVIIFTGIGIISLAGIVVNNSIVLIDYINLVISRRRAKLGLESILDMSKQDVKDAIVKGGATRLRPVLLTAITTVLGLMPLAVGFNINFATLLSELDPQIYFGGDSSAMWGPLARTVIYGLVFATFLTLIVVPVMYWLFYRLKWATEGYFYRKNKKAIA